MQAESIQSIDIIKGNIYGIPLAQWAIFTLTEIKFVVTVHYSFIFSVCSSAYYFPVYILSGHFFADMLNFCMVLYNILTILQHKQNWRR